MNIPETHYLAGAKHGHGEYSIPIYDDGDGPLWIMRDSMGIIGIVRASTWEDAYEICEDEFFPEADETVEELQKEYGFCRKHVKIVNSTEGERPVRDSDYIDGKLPPHSFVRWDTIETPDPDAWHENGLFCEAYGFRPNGPRAGKRPDGRPRDPIGHGIYAKDPNGEHLDLLTDEMIQALEIKLELAEFNTV